MSFALPTLGDLLDRTRKAFRSALPGTDAFIWPNNIAVSAKVIAGAVFEAFGFAAYISKCIFASTAPDLETLILHGNEFGIALRPAEPARGTIRWTTDGDFVVARGAVFARTDGVNYIATAGASRIGAGTLDVSVIAETDGINTNAQHGTSVDIVSGVTGTGTGEVWGGIAGGIDTEDMESFRARILFRKRNPPHGGNPADYVMWGSSVSGVTRVFVERRWAGPGTVRVFVLMDDLYTNGIPSPADVQRVADYIETQRPSGAVVTYEAPSAVAVNVTIENLKPDTVEIREAILAELRETFRRLSRPAGADTPNSAMPYLATPTSFSKLWIDAAVINAVGVVSADVDAPLANVALIPGQMATLGAVTFL